MPTKRDDIINLFKQLKTLDQAIILAGELACEIYIKYNKVGGGFIEISDAYMVIALIFNRNIISFAIKD